MSATRWRRDREQQRAVEFDVVWDGDENGDGVER